MIHICFNLDKKYVEPCKVCINSILKNTKEKITFHFIGIDETDMKCESKCLFYPKPDLSMFKSENLEDYGYFSQAAMYRLLIPFIIDVDKALYIDIDTLVRDDIKKLYDIKVDYVGAVIDPCSVFHGKRLGLGKNYYYNSGVILFNSKKIRESMLDYKEKILKAQEDYELLLKDQDIFNVVFKNHITTIGYEWNMDAHNLHEKEESKVISNLKDIAYKNPSLVHCMGELKWWLWKNVPFGTEWDNYNNCLMDVTHKGKIDKHPNGIVVVTKV